MKYQTIYLFLNNNTVYIFKGWNTPKFLWRNSIWRAICWLIIKHTKQQKTYPLEDFDIEQHFPDIKEIWPKLVEASQFYTIKITLSRPIKEKRP